MPALSGDPWRGLAKIQLVDSLGLGRYWTVSVTDVSPVTATDDQADWDFEGDTVAVTLRAEWDQDPGTALSVSNSMAIQVAIPGGSAAGATTWTVTTGTNTGSATRVLHFDSDALDEVLASSANRRYGMLELYFKAIRTAGAGATHYNVDSRGVATVGPPALTTYSWARGYLRQRATVSTLNASNVSLAGSQPSQWSQPDPIYIRATPTTSAFENINSGIVYIRRPQAEGGAAERQANSGVGTLFDFTMSGSGGSTLDDYVGAGMFLGSENKDVDVQFPASTFGSDQKFAWATSQPAGFSLVDERTLRYVGKMTAVDPRMRFTDHHLLQVDDPAYGTPPMSKNEPSAERQDAEFGFIGSRARNSRGDGMNGITWTTKMWDANEFSGDETSPTVSQSTTSATRGGEVGWAASLMPWSELRPGGEWTKKVVVTAPSAAVGTEQDNQTTLTLVVADPRVVLSVAAGDPVYAGKHWSPGHQLTVGCRLFRNFAPVAPDTDSGSIGIMRFDPATGRLQYLESVSPAVWQFIVDGSDITTFAMTSSPGDAALFLKTFTAAQTADFDERDLFIRAQLIHEGAEYNQEETLLAVGGHAPHDQLVVLRVRAGNLSAPGRHVKSGDAITIGAALQDQSGIIAMDASSVYYSAQRLNASTSRFQTWNGTAWVNQTALIDIPMTIGANPLEPLLALATLPSAAVDSTDNIFIFAKCTHTRAGTSYAQPHEGEDTVEVVGDFFPHDAQSSASIPESAIAFDPVSGHHHVGTDSRAIGER